MADDSAFLSAIIAAPDDDTPRLVFADWLDENSDAPRAEFIRIQIENHHRPTPALARRSDELLKQHRERWIIPGISGVQTFRRGFVEGLRMAAEDFLANAERIGRTAPIVELRLPIATDHLEALAAVPWLERISRFDLTSNVGLASQLNEFFGRVQLPQLQILELRNCQLWPEDMSVLGLLAHRWPRLDVLNLSGNPISDSGLNELAHAAHFARLTALIIRCDEQQFVNAIHPPGAASLAGSPWFLRLKHLDLNGHYIGDAGLVDLLRSPKLRGVELLDLGYNEIGTFSMDCYDNLMAPNRLPKLKRLILDGNRIEPLTLRNLSHWPRLATMELLSFRDCDLPDAAELIASSPWREKIEIESGVQG